jgi:hypothetical protein
LKKLIASRKLKRRCIVCDAGFEKGNVYYTKRVVYEDCSWTPKYLVAYEMLICPRCKYKEEQHSKRFKHFQEVCTHPDKFVETAWSYIPGECVKEPDFDFCRLCVKKLGGD